MNEREIGFEAGRDWALRNSQIEINALREAADWLWAVVANAGGGDWSKETPEWQEAARKSRDNFLRLKK